ncbi:MAG: hypothetical protein PHH77_02850 [Victivallaceae bacterium]|nr:hypothetical protein [Victivallaceae bacterium]
MVKSGIFQYIRGKTEKFISVLNCVLFSRNWIKAKKHQKLIFASLCKAFSAKYRHLKNAGKFEEFVTPQWEIFNFEAEKSLLPRPSFSFLRNSIVARAMFVAAGGDWLKQELSFLEEKMTEEQLRTLLPEDLVGRPLLLNSKYMTSHNTIHHLYSLVKFLTCTRCDLEQVQTVVEWGGGYGNMAKLFHRLKYGALTYVIIDTPLFSCVQWLYLSTVLGEKSVNLIQDSAAAVISGKINILPVNFIHSVPVDSDLFISTWALSESSKYSQDFVVNKDFFKARHLLVAWHDDSGAFPDSGRIAQSLAAAGATIEDIEFLPANHYAFR